MLLFLSAVLVLPVFFSYLSYETFVVSTFASFAYVLISCKESSCPYFCLSLLDSMAQLTARLNLQHCSTYSTATTAPVVPNALLDIMASIDSDKLFQGQLFVGLESSFVHSQATRWLISLYFRCILSMFSVVFCDC